MKLSPNQEKLLLDIATGGTLKAQRDLEGNKRYWLRELNGEQHAILDQDIEILKRAQLIDSNMKFPAATYLLTDNGSRFVERLTGSRTKPLFTRNYSQCQDILE